jgi:hypothetical protein
VRIHGTPAWLAWLALHLITLLGGRNRITALVNMSWRYLTWRRGGGFIVGDGMTGLTPLGGPAGAAAGQTAASQTAAGRTAASSAGTDPGRGPEPG